MIYLNIIVLFLFSLNCFSGVVEDAAKIKAIAQSWISYYEIQEKLIFTSEEMQAVVRNLSPIIDISASMSSLLDISRYEPENIIRVFKASNDVLMEEWKTILELSEVRNLDYQRLLTAGARALSKAKQQELILQKKLGALAGQLNKKRNGPQTLTRAMYSMYAKKVGQSELINGYYERIVAHIDEIAFVTELLTKPAAASSVSVSSQEFAPEKPAAEKEDVKGKAKKKKKKKKAAKKQEAESDADEPADELESAADVIPELTVRAELDDELEPIDDELAAIIVASQSGVGSSTSSVRVERREPRTSLRRKHADVLRYILEGSEQKVSVPSFDDATAALTHIGAKPEGRGGSLVAFWYKGERFLAHGSHGEDPNRMYPDQIEFLREGFLRVGITSALVNR